MRPGERRGGGESGSIDRKSFRSAEIVMSGIVSEGAKTATTGGNTNNTGAIVARSAWSQHDILHIDMPEA